MSIDVQSLSKSIKQRGMTAPAIFMLELYKPLAGTIFNCAAVAFPLLTVLLGKSRYEAGMDMLRSPDAIEDLIKALEK